MFTPNRFMIFIEIFKASKIKLIASDNAGMVRAYCSFTLVLLLIAADTITSLIQNKTIHNVNNSLKNIEARRHLHKKPLSTSSESGDRRSNSDEEDSAISLGISSESSSSDSNRRPKPKSSEERRGWRKWHRKCPPCPEDMVKKWRDRSIDWICGGYQRARRSFKSECMMYYRNCQDGTMFVKLHDYRCQNDTGTDLRHGLHFFYEYGKDSQNSKSSFSSDSSLPQGSSEIYQ